MPIDYKKYPKNWKTEIRPRILKRADNKCEFCKVPNHSLILRGVLAGIYCYQDMDGNVFSAIDGEPLGGQYLGDIDNANDGSRIVLTIAHLDHDITNNSDENLKALCQRCHNNYDLKNRLENRRKTKIKKQPELF